MAQLLLKASLENPIDMIILSIDRNYRYLFFNTFYKSLMINKFGKNIELGMNLLEFFSTEAGRKKARPFVACILDLTIPGGMGGKETGLKLRKVKSDAILFAASGYSEDPVMSNPKEHGFTDKITKPFRKTELAELLNLHFKNC